jgi:hypothetical protein
MRKNHLCCVSAVETEKRERERDKTKRKKVKQIKLMKALGNQIISVDYVEENFHA